MSGMFFALTVETVDIAQRRNSFCGHICTLGRNLDCRDVDGRKHFDRNAIVRNDGNRRSHSPARARSPDVAGADGFD